MTNHTLMADGRVACVAVLVVTAVLIGVVGPATASAEVTPPSVEVTVSPSSPVVGQPVTVAVSSDETLQSMTVSVDGEEVASTDGSNATITFDEPGSHTVEVTVTGTDAESTTATREIGVDANTPPEANLFLPSAVTECEVFTTDATRSSDPDGPIATYELDTDGDGTFEKRNDSGRFDHRILSTGARELTLRVTDQSGATATATDTVRVIEETCDDPVTESDWAQPRANHRATGHSSSAGPGEDGTVAASLSLASADAVPDDLTIDAPPAVGDRVFVAGDTGDGSAVVAFGATSGELEWVHTVDAEVGAPAIGETGVVVVTTDDGRLQGIGVDSGELSWESELPDDRGEVASDPIVRGSNLYVNTLDTDSNEVFLHLYDLADGSRKWSTQLGDGDTAVVPAAAVANRQAYAADGTGTLHAVSRTLGSVEWSYEAGDSIRRSPAVDEGVVYVGTTDGQIAAVDGASGTGIWTAEVGGNVATSPSIAGDAVYVGTATGEVIALDADTGESLWSIEVSGVPSGTAVDGNGVVYVTTTGGQIQAIRDGTRLWAETPAGATGAPGITDGLVVTGDEDGTVHVGCLPASAAGDDAVDCEDISESVTQGGATTTSANTTEPSDDGGSDGGSDSGMPGFGVGTALAAILAAGLLLWRTRE